MRRAQRDGAALPCVIPPGENASAAPVRVPLTRSMSRDRNSTGTLRGYRAARLEDAEMPGGRFGWKRGLALCAVTTGILAAAAPATAQGVVKNTFGDWQLRCETPAGA